MTAKSHCNHRVYFSNMLCGHCGLAVALFHFNLSLRPRTASIWSNNGRNRELSNHTLAFRSFFLEVTHSISAHDSLAKSKSHDSAKINRVMVYNPPCERPWWVNSNIAYHNGPGQGLTVLSVSSGLPPLSSPLPSD